MENTTLWKLLWDHDPNGLLVLDQQMVIRLVNPALCRMVKTKAHDLLGSDAEDVLGNVREFRKAFNDRIEVLSHEQAYPQYDLYVRQMIFPVPDEHVVAGIFVDMTHEWKQRRALKDLRQQVIQEVSQVVDKQMRVAQEIAGLLGETTAETKVGLLRLVEMLRQEHD